MKLSRNDIAVLRNIHSNISTDLVPELFNEVVLEQVRLPPMVVF